MKIEPLESETLPAGLLVWWTNQADAERLGEEPDWSLYPSVPHYVRDEFGSRYGRPGRGRLWIPQGISDGNLPWDNDRPTCRAAADCGGIVFLASDLASVRALPGFITDTMMNEVLAR